MVGEDNRLFLARVAVDFVDDVGDFLLGQQPIDQVEGDVLVARQNLAQQHPARCRLAAGNGFVAFLVNALIARQNLRMQVDNAGVQGLLNLADVDEGHAFAGFALALHGQVIESENDILTGNDDRLAVGRAEDVVGRHHQDPGLQLGFQGQRHVHGHLVAVEVGVEGSADQGMKLNRLALDQKRLECLNAEPVQGRRPVQKHRVFADDFFKNVPDFGPFLLQHPLRRLDGGRHAILFKLGVEEGLEKLQCHFFRQPALMQHQFRSDHDHRAAGIIDALAEQVLAEPALFTLQHVGKGF